MARYLIPAGVLVLAGVAWAGGAGGRPTGTLKVDTPGLVLKLDGGKSRVVGKPKEIPVPPLRAVPLPAGSYKGVSATLHSKDKAGKLWSLETKGKLGQLAEFTIAEGETTTLKGGGPLRVNVRVSVLTADDITPSDVGLSGAFALVPSTGRFIWVVVRYVGQAGEQYFPRFKVGNLPKPLPSIRIFDEDGRSLTQGDYKRGGFRVTSAAGDTAREREGFLCEVPIGFTKRIRVKVIHDTGPFTIEPEAKPKLHSVAPKRKGR